MFEEYLEGEETERTAVNAERHLLNKEDELVDKEKVNKNDVDDNMGTFRSELIEFIVDHLQFHSDENDNEKTYDNKLVAERIAVNVIEELLTKVSSEVTVRNILNEVISSIDFSRPEHINVLKYETVMSSRIEEAALQYIACIDFVEEESKAEILLEEEVECLPYLNLETIAEDVVKKVIDEAETKLQQQQEEEEEKEEEDRPKLSTDESRSSEDDPYYNVPYVEVFEKDESIDWPTIENFTTDIGKMTIYQYLDTWYTTEDWLYCVNFLGCRSDEVTDYYYYQAVWSIPTPAYPIPQATASVFFTFAASRVIPKQCKVKVTYQFEGTRFIHQPGKIEPHEDWLFYIIDSKLNLFKTITF